MHAGEFSKLWFKINREMKVHLEEQLGPTLTEGQLNVLEYMFANAPVKPSDLIDYLATTPAAVTTLLDRMEKAELIERQRDDQDRRIVWIRMTEKGDLEGRRGVQIKSSFIQSCLDRISTHNQQLLVFLLGKVCTNEVAVVTD